jgi:hypothetical protein
VPSLSTHPAGSTPIPEIHPLNGMMYQRFGLIFDVKRANKNGLEYITNVHTPDGQKVGFFCFRISNPTSDQPQTVFMGILVTPEFRGRGISNIFMNEISQLSQLMGIPFNQTSKQFKPLMCALLTKHGFTPANKPNSCHAAIVGKSDGPTAPVFFGHKKGEAHFRRSKLYTRATNYEIVDSIEDIRDGIDVILGSRYLLTDRAKMRAKLKQTSAWDPTLKPTTA